MLKWLETLWVVSSLFCGGASCLASAVFLLQRPGVARQRPDFFCLAKRNRGKKTRALQAAIRRNSLRAYSASLKQPPEIGFLNLGTRDAYARVGSLALCNLSRLSAKNSHRATGRFRSKHVAILQVFSFLPKIALSDCSLLFLWINCFIQTK
jgi:hypothetical protein